MQQMRRSAPPWGSACADFFLVHILSPARPHQGAPKSSERVLAMFRRLALEYPYWNSKVEKPYVSHHISPCDHGPGDCMFDRESFGISKHHPARRVP